MFFIIEHYDDDNGTLLLVEEARKLVGEDNVILFDTHKDYIKYIDEKGPLFDFIKDKSQVDQPLIFSGSIQLANKILRSPAQHAVISTIDNYDYNWFLAYFGKYALNSNCQITPYSKIQQLAADEEAFGSDKKIFLRPVRGDKSFNSGLYRFSDISKGIAQLNYYGGVSPETLVVSSKPVKILREYRVFIKSTNFNDVKKDIIGPSCLYIENDEFIPNGPEATNEILKFVSHVLDEIDKRPDILFTLDVAVLENGSMAILELNAGSTSGIYGANKENMAKIMKEAAEDKWRFIQNGFSWNDEDRI